MFLDAKAAEFHSSPGDGNWSEKGDLNLCAMSFHLLNTFFKSPLPYSDLLVTTHSVNILPSLHL